MRRAERASETVRIALVGKYVKVADSYLSVVEALRHAGFHHGAKIEVFWVDSETLDEEESRAAARGGRRHPDPRRLRHARHRGQDQRRPGRARAADPVPRDLPRHADRASSTSPATSSAWTAPTRPSSIPRRPIPVIDLLPEQKEVDDMGGTMRLGADPVKLHAGHAGARRRTTSRSSTSATATATRSTTCCAAGSRTPAWSAAAPRRTTAWSR